MDEEILKNERMYATSSEDMLLDHHYRYEFALNFIQKGDLILDAASGCGYGVHYMAENSDCALSVGVDRSEHAMEWALKYFYSEKTFYVKSDLSKKDWEIPIAQFDVITCFETVEHMLDDKTFVKKLYDLLKIGGHFIISAPNENVIPYLENPYFLGGVNPHHFRHYRPEDLCSLLKHCGFQIVQELTQDNTTYELVSGRLDGFSTVLVATK